LLIADIIVSGLILGGLYALLAMGLTLQYGAARIINLAYGEVLIGASFFAYVLFTGTWGINPLLALLVVMPAGFAVSWGLYRVMLLPLVGRARNREQLEVDSILATFGLLFVLQGIAFVIFGGQYYSYSFLLIPVSIASVTVPVNRLIAFAFAVTIATFLYVLLTRTRQGTAVRAIAADPAVAQLVGIDVVRLASFAFALGGALCAAAGVLSSMFLTFSAARGVEFTMKALIVVIMGGVGNMLGTLVAGLLLGLVEILVARLVDPGLTLAANFALFLGVLLLKPTGLFGSPSR
jgi:branched-chain amino acid transport system permease protein